MTVFASTVLSLWSAFATPPESARPWCYWWWVNGHTDRQTITADLESMKRLGFGGILMIDSRGYWENDEHVVNPKAELGWGTEGWYDLVEFSIRECARLGLEFSMNASASGGTLNGFIDGKEYEVDVMNRDEVVAHLDRAVGPLLKRVPDLVGKTFTHIYSVSYEGSVKTGGSWSAIKDNFYATMKDWSHSHGLKVFSESGGPWAFGAKAAKLDCDQLDLLAHNDFPQGEFWVLDGCLEGPDGVGRTEADASSSARQSFPLGAKAGASYPWRRSPTCSAIGPSNPRRLSRSPTLRSPTARTALSGIRIRARPRSLAFRVLSTSPARTSTAT